MVLTALLAGRTVETAAAEAKVNPSTVHRWLNEADFRAAQQAGRRELAQQALGLIQTATRSAVGVVVELMSDRTKPATVRLRAAQIVIEASLKWLELSDMEARLAALEAKHAEKL
jgi:hypothetical protein